MFRIPLKLRSLSCSVLLLLVATLPSPCLSLELPVAAVARVSAASARISSELGKAHKLTAALAKEGAVTSEEKKKLDLQFSLAYRRASELAQEIYSAQNAYAGAYAGPVPILPRPATMSGAQLASEYVELVEDVEGLSQIIASLASQGAQKSYKPFLENIGDEVGTLAKALRCEKVDDKCVKCSDGVVRCPPKK